MTSSDISLQWTPSGPENNVHYRGLAIVSMIQNKRRKFSTRFVAPAFTETPIYGALIWWIQMSKFAISNQDSTPLSKVSFVTVTFY